MMAVPDEVQINAGVEDISGTAEGVEHVWSWDIPANTTLTVGKAGKIRVKAETPSGQKTLAVAERIPLDGRIQEGGSRP